VSRTSRLVRATPADVFAVLADGWLYPSWVVGASRVRAVDAAWPQPGSRIHHSVGVWPVLIDDDTEVEELVDQRLLVLKARAWPAGEARVRISTDVEGAHCRVTIEEDAVSGPGALIPAPARHGLLDVRNRETLARLAYLAEGNAGLPSGGTPAVPAPDA
jgi:uncharacterized protein YndB with AHSA1/START domain